MPRDFNIVWEELKAIARRKRVVYTFETRKMQVIEDVTDDGFVVNDDPTHKKQAYLVDRDTVERAFNAINIRGVMPRGDLMGLVGAINAEFLIVMFDLLDDFTYDNLTIRTN